MSYILIVEDELSILDLLEQVLGDDGYTTVGVGNGRAALAAIAANCPDCILLDLNLPLLDGEGVLRALASRAVRPPVLMMTADPRGQRFGPADGVVGHVPKPFDLDHLTDVVAMTIQQYEHEPAPYV
jgi:CheY-like chemotaxis protein